MNKKKRLCINNYVRRSEYVRAATYHVQHVDNLEWEYVCMCVVRQQLTTSPITNIIMRCT